MNHNIFLSLGGNVGDSVAILSSALNAIAEMPGVFNLKSSRFYQTSPVGNLKQRDFVNTATRFSTTLSAQELLLSLQEIERRFGKEPKPKNAPRTLDIDILFFGNEWHDSPSLQLPHPAWKERLFVLIPLLDLTSTISYPTGLAGPLATLDVREYLKEFEKGRTETVYPLI